MSGSADQGPFPEGDRVPPAQGGPRFELLSIGRTLDDLAPAEKQSPLEGVRSKLMWSAAALLALMAIMGWWLLR